MSKKLFISIAPLLATVAFVAMPATSQAATKCVVNLKCHWYVNSGEKGSPAAEGKAIPVLSWGTLSLSSVKAGSISCKNAILGTNENPTGGGPGVDETNNFSSADCVATGCESAGGFEGVVTAEDLPWGAELEQSTLAGKFVVRNDTRPEPPLTKGLATGTLWQSTVGAQVTTRCTFRPNQILAIGEGFEAKTVGAILIGKCELEAAEKAANSEPFESEAECEARGAAEGKAFEEGELMAQEVPRPAIDPSYAGYPESEPGRPPVLNVPNFGPGSPTEKAFVSQCNEATFPTHDQKPSLKPGTSPAKPSQVEFDSEVGTLDCGALGAGTTSGKLKSEGYEEEEVIAAY